MSNIHLKLTELKERLQKSLDNNTKYPKSGELYKIIRDSLVIMQLGIKFNDFLRGDQRNHIGGGLDLDLLHQQKLALIEVRILLENNPILKGYGENLGGIVAFLDAFQDLMADDLGLWEFPTEEDTEAV